MSGERLDETRSALSNPNRRNAAVVMIVHCTGRSQKFKAKCDSHCADVLQNIRISSSSYHFLPHGPKTYSTREAYFLQELPPSTGFVPGAVSCPKDLARPQHLLSIYRRLSQKETSSSNANAWGGSFSLGSHQRGEFHVRLVPRSFLSKEPS